jgi:hypothetical protein
MTDSEALDILVVWATDRGYHIDFVDRGDNCICYITKIIEINKNQTPEHKLHCLLHECGHALIFNNGSSHDFKKTRDKSFNKTSRAYRVYTVLEEGEAWDRGRRLARRLSIPIDEEKWERGKVRALMKYINWASTN